MNSLIVGANQRPYNVARRWREAEHQSLSTCPDETTNQRMTMVSAKPAIHRTLNVRTHRNFNLDFARPNIGGA